MLPVIPVLLCFSVVMYVLLCVDIALTIPILNDTFNDICMYIF